MVELQIIINQLKSGCKDCRLPLNLCQAQGVLPRGLGGWLYIFCDNPACKAINKVAIGKQHNRLSIVKDIEKKRSGYKIFYINTKAAGGMIHCGIGETHLNQFLSVLNLPEISRQTVKNREDELALSWKYMQKIQLIKP